MSSDEVLPSGGEFNKSEPDAAAEVARRLSPKHLADLRASELSDATILANRCWTERVAAKIAAMLNCSLSRARSYGACLCIPYLDADGKPLPALDRETGLPIPDADGNPVPSVRLKPDNPLPGRNGKPRKYEACKGARNRLYVPPATWATLAADPTARIVFVEGEKKAARGAQDGIACVGVSGVDNWSLRRAKPDDPRVPLPDFDWLALRGRLAAIAYDSDAVTNRSVLWAEWNLANALADMGACVVVVRLPGEQDGTKNGLDDFLVRYGLKSFEERLLAAVQPTHPTTGAYRDTLCIGGEGEGNLDTSGPAPTVVRYLGTRRVQYCPHGSRSTLLGCIPKTEKLTGRNSTECGILKRCAACLNNAKIEWHTRLVAAVATSTRPVAMTTVAAWLSLRSHLNRQREKQGTPKPDHIVVRRSPTSRAFVVMLGAPDSNRMTPTPRLDAARELSATLEAVELCPDHPGHWFPVTTSIKRKKEEKKERAFMRVDGIAHMEDAAMLAIFRRHGCRSVRKVRRQWRFMVEADERQSLLDAIAEAQRGHITTRYLPLRPGFAGLDYDFEWMFTGEPPSGMLPLSRMPVDSDRACDAVDRLVPGLAKRVWECGDIDSIREVLRGLIHWSAEGLGNTQDEVLADVVSPTLKPATPATAEPAELTPDVAPDPDEDSECGRLRAELRALVAPLPQHWRSYVEIRIEAGPDDPDNLERAIEWVKSRPRVDGERGAA